MILQNKAVLTTTLQYSIAAYEYFEVANAAEVKEALSAIIGEDYSATLSSTLTATTEHEGKSDAAM